MKKPTLIIDGQLLQTNAFFRGMGGYTYNLIAHFMQLQPDVRVLAVLNNRLECNESRLQEIASVLPGVELHRLDLPFQPGDDLRAPQAARQVLNDFIAREAPSDTHEVAYFIPAIFLFDFCAVFPDNVRKLLLFHDLTPLVFREDLAKYFPAHLYFPRFKTIFEADTVFTNSETTGHDLELYLGYDPVRMVNLDGSLNAHAHGSSAPDLATAKSLKQRLGVTKTPYLLMPTGGTEFKNNVRAAQAFARLSQSLSPDIKLLVTSFFRDEEKAELRDIAGENVVFTDNVSNEELAALYKDCLAVVLPSLYEGLGLPVLEGVAYEKPVACADIAVFREIPHCREALYMFDPYDIEDMAEAMLRAAAAAGFEQKRSHYADILQKYDWSRSAATFADALWGAVVPAPAAPTKRLAVLCPDPRKNNDVAVFAQRMYGFARRSGIECVFFIDPGGPDTLGETILPDYIRSLALTYDIQDVYEKLPELHLDAVVHFLSGDKRFTKLLRAALTLPGHIYIGNTSYREVVDAMYAEGLISESQAQAELGLHDIARADGGFETVSLFGGAKGIIGEKHITRPLARSQKQWGTSVPVLEVPECAVVNHDPMHALERQRETYAKVLGFVVEGNE